MVRFNIFVALFFAWIVGCSAPRTAGRSAPATAQYSRFESQPFAGAVLLNPEHPRTAVLASGFHPLWNPPSNLVMEAFNQLTNYLQHIGSEELSHPAYEKELPGVQARLPKTLCQAIGVSWNGHRGILLNCLPTTFRWEQRWQDGFIKVFDGGPRYWSIVYLTDAGKFDDLHIGLGF